MNNIIKPLIVCETSIKSYTGEYLYSDSWVEWSARDLKGRDLTWLNESARYLGLGILAGIARIALGVIHTFGHLILAALTREKGHLFHAAKGGCEIFRGLIEAIPIIGRIFVHYYNPPSLESHIRPWIIYIPSDDPDEKKSWAAATANIPIFKD